jgi:hypothetical protein
MTKRLFKIIGVLIVAEAISFFIMIVTSMTDEEPPVIAKYSYWLLKYVFGFPLILVNKNYPFFIDAEKIPTSVILLVIINNTILALMIYSITWFFKPKAK